MTTTRPSRRAVMAGLGAAVAAPSLLPTSAPAAAPAHELTAAPAKASLMGPGKTAAEVWAYDGTVPGPILRLRQGEEVLVRVRNALPEPTAVHWHGLRIANAMDGVPHLTQHPIEPGADLEYRFTPPDAGTFWYHPHERSFEQVPRGLYGALIVEEAQPPTVDHDLVLAISDWRLTSDGALIEGFGSRHDQAHAGRLGNTITVNGSPFFELPVRRNDRIRLRLINACSARVLKLRLEKAFPKLVAIDGQPVGPTTTYEEALTLGPANRADLMLDITGEAGGEIPITDIGGERTVLGALRIATGEPRRPSPLVAPIALEPNRLAVPSRDGALHVPLVMTGGAANEADMAALTGSGPVWAFNGVSGMQEAPLFSVTRGRSVVIVMENRTAWPHAMHLHGHHFRVLSRSGVAEEADTPPRPYWWDTFLIQPGEVDEIAFVADNPGKWMLHCHMLDHQLGGMDTWFEVREA